MVSNARSFGLLCLHCFFAFAALGTHLPYLALFLRENIGLTSSQVGLVVAIPPLVGLFAQPAWGQLADRTGSRVRVLFLLCLGASAGFVGLSQAHGLAGAVAATLALALFLSALFSLSTSVILGALASPSHFGRVRAWGTIGYLVVVVASPRALAWLQGPRTMLPPAGGPSEPALPWLFCFAACCLLVAGASVALLPRRTSLSVRSRKGDLHALLSQPAFRRVLVFFVGIQLFLHGPMQLFPLYVRSRGGSMTEISNLWICMLALEIPLIFGSARVFASVGVTRMMRIAALSGGLRWVVCALVPTLPGVYAVQVLHAVVVTGLMVGTALYVEQIVPARLRATAQGTVVMLGSSVGGVLSSALGGLVLERFGVDWLYLTFGLGAVGWALTGRSLLVPDAVSGRRLNLWP